MKISNGKSSRQKITKVTETLNFGKYKDSLFIKDIIACDAAYILWLDVEGIVEFTNSIIEKAEESAMEQHREWLRNNYADDDYDVDPRDYEIYGYSIWD
jgi:hypothetical protein